MLGYSYFYSRTDSEPPYWYTQGLREYLETFLPAYVSKYLHLDLVVEPAGFASAPPPKADSGRINWLAYFESLRAQITWGYDSLVVMTDAPYSDVNPFCTCAGQNFYRLSPNFGWTSLRNWDQVEALSRNTRSSPFYSFMLGSPSNPGIDALAVVGHEMLHYAILAGFGVERSAELDGGGLSGMVFLDEQLNPISRPELNPPNFQWAAQRVLEELPCHSRLGAYRCL